MKKSIFQMEVVIDTEEKSIQTHLHMDKEDFEPDGSGSNPWSNDSQR